MIDEIISSAKEFKMDESTRKNMYNLMTVYNKLITEDNNKIKTNTNKMENTEKLAELESKIKNSAEQLEALTKQNEELTQKNEELLKKLEQFEAKAAEEEHNKAVALVENAIKDGKVEETNKESLIKAAKLDYETISNTLSAIIVKGKKSVSVLDAAKAGNIKNGDSRDTWSIRDWEKKDPDGLTKIYKTDRAEYDRMYDAFYKQVK